MATRNPSRNRTFRAAHRACPGVESVEGLEPRVLFATLTVGAGDGVGKDGVVTIREAIMAANTNAAVGDCPAGTAGLDTIKFAIPPGGTRTISPRSPLPAITDTIFIDGNTQPGTVPAGTLKVELNGTNAGAGVDGLVIRASNSVVRGLAINRFGGDGIELAGANSCIIVGNYLGTDPTGMVAFGNGGGPLGSGAGIAMNSATNRVGTDGNGVNDAAERNVISANGVGVRIDGSVARGNVVAGNHIGVNRTGTAALGNGRGVLITNGAGSNLVGTDGVGSVVAERNVISGNTRATRPSPSGGGGVEISQKSNNNVVAGNYIGTNAAGNAALPNNNGVVVLRGSTTSPTGYPADPASLGTIIGTNGNAIGDEAERNVISGNLNVGVFSDDQSVIAGNYIGTAADGINPMGERRGWRLHPRVGEPRRHRRQRPLRRPRAQRDRQQRQERRPDRGGGPQ